MKFRVLYLLLIVALALLALPRPVTAQSNGCHVCFEESFFHWVADPPVPVFEGIAYAHGIQLGGCESHTHLLISCHYYGLTEAQQELARRLLEHPATLPAAARANLARYFQRQDPERFAFLDPAVHATPEPRLAYRDCQGRWTTLALS